MSENTSTSEIAKELWELCKALYGEKAKYKDYLTGQGKIEMIRDATKHIRQSNDQEKAGREKSELMRLVRWSGIDEQEPKERQYLYLACTELVGPREDKYVIEGYKDGGRYYAFADGETGGTEISKDSIDYWTYKNAPEHPDT